MQYLCILLQDWTSIFATTCHFLSYSVLKFNNLLHKLDFFTWNLIEIFVFWYLMQYCLQTKQSNEKNDCLYSSPRLGVLKSRILMTWLCNLLALPPLDKNHGFHNMVAVSNFYFPSYYATKLTILSLGCCMLTIPRGNCKSWFENSRFETGFKVAISYFRMT